MFVVLQNLNTDLPKRFKCLIYDKINTIRAVLLLFQICAAVLWNVRMLMIVFSYFIEFSVVDKVSHYLATAKTDV